jgi:hypothetical protein
LLRSIGKVQAVKGHHHVKGIVLEGKIRGVCDGYGSTADRTTASREHLLLRAKANDMAPSHGEGVRKALIHAGGEHQGPGPGAAREALPKGCKLGLF